MRSDYENYFYLIEMCWWTHEKLLWRVVNLEMKFSIFFKSELFWLKVFQIYWPFCENLELPSCRSGKESTCQCRDTREEGSIPGSGRFPGEGTGNPLQYSCLGNPMDRGAWWATVSEIAKSRTQLNAHTYTLWKFMTESSLYPSMYFQKSKPI